ncbi:MAG: glycoside hydrolase family 43 protein [Cyclobacteriaceae bacterium]
MKLLSFSIALLLCSTLGICQTSQITNPILSGFHPDPSICRAGNDYYLINSTFAYFPGLPIYKSSDLVNWKQIGHVLDRPSQLPLQGAWVSGGLYAPTIRYNNGTFYVVCTLIERGNFIVTTKNPEDGWSEPVYLPEIKGIDPSLFFDDDGKAYIVHNSSAPNNQPLYEGHSTIRLSEFDIVNMKVVGEDKIIVNGGTDINKKPRWIEGPHLLKKDGHYYLICAEGGTEYNHSEVVFQSNTIFGPYTPYEKNPILTQRTLDRSRKNPITSTGHADFVESENGDWWAVFLGCRPYEDDHYNTGRETFMAPIQWKDGWPIVNPDFAEVQYHYPVKTKSAIKSKNDFSGNFSFTDNFDNDKLNVRYEFLRTPNEKWYNFSDKKGFLSLQLRPQTCGEPANPSFIGFLQSHLKGSASTAMNFTAQTENEKAGLLVFQNDNHYYFLCKSVENNQAVVQLYQSKGNNSMELIASEKISDSELQLKIVAKEKTYSFLFSTNRNHWVTLKENVDAKFLSTQTGGGFVGSLYAMYATSNGKMSNNKAYFDWFNYQGDDEVYK